MSFLCRFYILQTFQNYGSFCHLNFRRICRLKVIIVKEKIQKNGLISEKLHVSCKYFTLQKYKFVDFKYTDVQNCNKHPDYHSVLSRGLDASI